MTYSQQHSQDDSVKPGLNPQQREAARTIDVPMLVLAGAGSGKTRVITEKIAYLIGECGISPSRIAAVTFTNKSAQEMKSRVKKLVGAKGSRGLRVSTFHRLALTILQKEFAALDYKPGFSVFASADCITVLSELLKVTGDRGLDAAESAHWQISQWKNDGIMPEQAFDVAEDDRQAGIAKLYIQYQRQLHAYNAFDLDDLILFPEMDVTAKVPEITTSCWGILGKDPADMMCASSRMVVKHKGDDHLSVMACTLLPYDQRFNLGRTLLDAWRPVRLNHPHCAKFCVLGGASCSA